MSREGTVPAATGRRPPGDAEAVTPASEADLAQVLAEASRERRMTAIWGGGTHRQMGHQVASDLVISTSALSGIIDWQPEDLTAVVAAGTPVAELEDELSGGGQSAVLPEQPGAATVGGVVAAAISSYARLRYGPTRDRLLEVRAVTGDGRMIKGGGRVVKNVTGYDLPRLYTGSFGSLGVITSVCLKLWPLSEAACTVLVDRPPPDSVVYRPRAVLQTRDEVRVYLSGTGREIDDQVRRLGGDAREGYDFPSPVSGEAVWSLRVRPGRVSQGVDRLPAGCGFVAQHGVGEITFETPSSFDVTDLRNWAEDQGGTLVLLRGETDADPWGTPPPTLALQRRVIAAFDPVRILEVGRLPGGL